MIRLSTGTDVDTMSVWNDLLVRQFINAVLPVLDSPTKITLRPSLVVYVKSSFEYSIYEYIFNSSIYDYQ